jgi:hypothetical protein
MSGPESEQFCLKWNDFQQCIKSTFQDLRDQPDFMDVTLSCDGEQVRAHKVILSACSVTFRHLLKANPAPNPVILLWVSEIYFLFRRQIPYHTLLLANFGAFLLPDRVPALPTKQKVRYLVYS